MVFSSAGLQAYQSHEWQRLIFCIEDDDEHFDHENANELSNKSGQSLLNQLSECSLNATLLFFIQHLGILCRVVHSSKI